jgi:preprotein translocase subunit SecA
VSLGGLDPLKRFTTDITMAFHRLEGTVDDAVLQALDLVSVSGGRIELSAIDIKGPTSTWTYLVNDDPFRNQIGMQLTGPGKATFAIGAALFAMPLLIFWGLVDRVFRKRSGRRADPFKR